MIQEINPSQIPSLNQLPPTSWAFDYEAFLKHYLPTNFFKAFVLTKHEEIVGTGNVFFKGKIGWLANIIISKKHRQQGLGAQMTEYLVDYLDNQGCETQLLIATELGERVYQKIGFNKIGSYQGFSSNQNQAYEVGNSIKKLNQNHLQSILDLDFYVNGECRKHFLEQYYKNGFGYFNEHDLLGYYLPAFGRGLIIAQEEEAGLELLKLKHCKEGRHTMLPIDNQVGINYLEKMGIEKTRNWTRMSLGKTINWNPKMIYSYASGYCG
jgi:GNAT superfamily N-acetyltransferase